MNVVILSTPISPTELLTWAVWCVHQASPKHRMSCSQKLPALRQHASLIHIELSLFKLPSTNRTGLNASVHTGTQAAVHCATIELCYVDNQSISYFKLKAPGNTSLHDLRIRIWRQQVSWLSRKPSTLPGARPPKWIKNSRVRSEFHVWVTMTPVPRCI